MGQLVQPKTYWIGCTGILEAGFEEYLRDSGNEEFLETRRESGLSDGEVLTSFYAKLCYKSLTVGQNANVSKIRNIKDNLIGVVNSGHGSVFEHVVLNFVVRNCSRVFTHELVRHRVGTAFSQTSGRYVRGDSIDIVFDPILEPVREYVEELQAQIEESYNEMVEVMELDTMSDFDEKKKITSALRRLLPNGQSNEIGFSVNLRALRHTIQMRTSRHAEWEIRLVFGQIYDLVREKYPLLFHGMSAEIVRGLIEVTGDKL